jgi:type II secretory ATPase GspE/PulE/Tfp pilus assembly ATPase PilB-like protein
MDHCHTCGRLLDSATFLIDPPGVLNLSDERYRAEGKPTRKLICLIILLAIKDRSTEVRFEPGRDEYRLRYRCNGVFNEMVPPPLHIHNQISSTLKAMANLEPHRRPQTGELQIKVDGHTILVRVETEPSEFGENVILWIPESHDSANAAETWLHSYCRRTPPAA